MTPNQIRELVRAAPFQPFRIHLADSRALEVPHPEFVAIQPDGRWIIVVNPIRLGGYELVNLSLTVLPDPPASQQARERRDDRGTELQRSAGNLAAFSEAWLA